MSEPKSHSIVRGRAAPSNMLSGRFSSTTREEEGDWRDALPLVDGEAKPPATTVTVDHARSILTRNASPDIAFDRSLNAYRGCEHGCIYCYARPSHAWHDLSPGLDFETRLFVKPDAAALLEKALSRPGYAVAPIAMGTNTDPYQPAERDWRITRACIAVLQRCHHPLVLTTKSDRILRDVDLLGDMAARGLVAVAISITSLTDGIARTLEPRAPHPQKRLAAIRALSDAGVPVQVNVAPVIPAVTDHEMEAIITAAAQAGARGAMMIPVRLPYEVAPLFRAWLDAHFPDRAGKVMAIIREMRGGRDNDPRFFGRMRGQGPWAQLLRDRFTRIVRKLDLNADEMHLRTDLFRPPEGAQLSLF